MTNDPESLRPPAGAAPAGSSADTGTDPRWRITPTKWVVAVILLVGIVLPLLVSTYDRIEPRLFGYPFFYWYQLLWVFLAAGLCGLSYWLLARERKTFRRDGGEARGEGGRR